MKKLVLDYSKWRCGRYGDNELGDGCTSLLNSQGFMCCLGQFSLQLNDQLHKDRMLGYGEPNELDVEIESLSELNEDEEFVPTNLTREAIKINDFEETTPDQKINLLKELFAAHNYEIEVINKP